MIYGLAFVDLEDGPVVFEAAPQMQGLLDDFWHRPLTDIGAAGPDQGKGGKFLLLPPGYTGETPSGYYVMKSPTYGVFGFLRAFLVDGKTDEGVKLMEQSRIYALAQKDHPPAMKFPNASGVPADCDFKRDLRYFESLPSSSTTSRSRPKIWRCAAWRPASASSRASPDPCRTILWRTGGAKIDRRKP